MKALVSAVTFAIILMACGVPAADVSQTLSDATKCAIGVIATAGGSIDVQNLLACGLTVADALKLLQDLRANATAPSDAGAAALSPERVAYVQKLDRAITELKAR